MRIHPVIASLPLSLSIGCGKAEGPAPPASTATTNAAPATSSSAAAPAASTPPAALAAAGELTVGQRAPDFSAKDQDGKPVHLAELKGKYVVVYFYPKDETPGCTKEACAFRDAWNDLSKKGVVIVGLSGDSDQSHKAFADHHKLPFLLVSDPKGEIAATYGVPFESGYAKRQSFVIAPDGTVKKIYRKVDVGNHANEIAADVR
jgi:peroxiredoxin Q/BCP